MKRSRKPDGATPRGYHHGDLRRHLIEVGERLLEKAGVEGFTLRECARQAGVSPSAPSHHFGNVMGLLTAIATLGFDGLTEAQEAALVGLEGDPLARLGRIARAYLHYAVAHPARFRILFGRVPLDESDAAFHASGSRALGVLRRELSAVRGRPLAGEGESDLDFDADVAFAWSAVHGYATLLINGQLLAINSNLDEHAYLNDLADRTVGLILRAFEAQTEPPGQT